MAGKFDLALTFLVTVLLTIGLTAVYSATSFSGIESPYFQRQIIFALFGFAIMISISFIPFRFIQRMTYPFYGFCIFDLYVFISMLKITT